MEINKIKNFKNGWFVGNFTPTLLNSNFEVSYREYKINEAHTTHFHKKSTEINLVVNGEIKINDIIFKKGDIFILKPFELSIAEFITDVELVVVRDISDPADKYNVAII